MKVCRSNFLNFCNQTSLHGWNFVGKDKIKSCNAIFWISTIFMTFGIGMFWIGFNTKEFFEATVEFNTLSLTTPLDEVYFPAIYIVNKNHIRKSILIALAKDELIKNRTTSTKLFHILVKSINSGKLDEKSSKIASGKLSFHILICMKNFLSFLL